MAFRRFSPLFPALPRSSPLFPALPRSSPLFPRSSPALLPALPRSSPLFLASPFSPCAQSRLFDDILVRYGPREEFLLPVWRWNRTTQCFLLENFEDHTEFVGFFLFHSMKEGRSTNPKKLRQKTSQACQKSSEISFLVNVVFLLDNVRGRASENTLRAAWNGSCLGPSRKSSETATKNAILLENA